MLQTLISAECRRHGDAAVNNQLKDPEKKSGQNLLFLKNFAKELGYIANLLHRDTEVVAVSSTVSPGGKGINVSMVGGSAEKEAEKPADVLRLATITNPDDIARRKKTNKFPNLRLKGKKFEQPPEPAVPPPQPAVAHTKVYVAKEGKSCWNEIKMLDEQDVVCVR